MKPLSDPTLCYLLCMLCCVFVGVDALCSEP